MRINQPRCFSFTGRAEGLFRLLSGSIACLPRTKFLALRNRWLPGMVAGTMLAILGLTPLRAGVQYDPASRRWTLMSGGVEYRLRQQDGAVYLEYFGPAGQPAGKPSPETSVPADSLAGRYDTAGQVEGQGLLPEDLGLTSYDVSQPRTGVDELRLVFKHRRLALEMAARYTTWGETGVITRQLSLVNHGDRPLRVEVLPSLSWGLPAGKYELTYLYGAWGEERQLASEPLGPGRRSFVSTRGRSTHGYSPWFCLHNQDRGVRYLAQLAYSGNWEMRFERVPGGQRLENEGLSASLGMRFDFGGPLRLAARESFTAPLVAFTATGGDLDEAANQLHRYQRQYVIPRTPTNDPLLVQFNSWYPFPGKMTVDQMKRCADIAAELGAEVFVLDAGWFNKKDWSRELGDWQADRVAFPNGLEELARYVRSKGMQFGMWVEIENLGVDSQTFREHPDWCLIYNARPLLVADRYHLNFAKPEVRQWARAVLDRLVRDYGIAWLKIDYNIDIGERFDPSGADRRGDVLYRHLTSYYAWLDEARAAYPKLVIENCSSGGTRFDLGIMAHAHTTWLSDNVAPLASLQLGYGCTVEFVPEVCNHWMVGDKDTGEVVLTNPPGWWDFILRVPMNGQFGISSRVFDWSPELKKRAAENVALYKRLRGVIMGADVYHLTPPPAHEDPVGWSAMQYVAPDQTRSLLMAYRLGKSGPSKVFKLRGLAESRRYQITIEGKSAGVFSGRELSEAGLAVELNEEWRTAVVELQAQP